MSDFDFCLFVVVVVVVVVLMFFFILFFFLLVFFLFVCCFFFFFFFWGGGLIVMVFTFVEECRFGFCLGFTCVIYIGIFRLKKKPPHCTFNLHSLLDCRDYFYLKGLALQFQELKEVLL